MAKGSSGAPFLALERGQYGGPKWKDMNRKSKVLDAYDQKSIIAYGLFIIEGLL